MHFEMLGPLRVRSTDKEISIPAGRERAVLLMLLLHAGRTVQTAAMMDAIWPADPRPGSRTRLQGCVSRLRKRLAAAGGTSQIIVTDVAGYRLVIEPHQLDALEFRRLVSEARGAAAAGRPDQAIERYRAGLDLWRGPVSSDVDGGLAHQLGALNEERLQALEERIELELAAGASRQLIPELQELVRQHPHREGLHCALMLALYRSDRQAEALGAFRHIRRLLHEELGIEPGPELQRLHHAILNRDAALRPAPAQASSRSIAAEDPVPRELPAAAAGFTGRGDALERLDRMLSAARRTVHPVLISVIAGTAGVGKTALAVHWAHQVTDRFPDGQLYLNLDGYTGRSPVRPVDALSLLLRSLGAAPDQIPSEVAAAAALYRTKLADRQVLILLDNARSVDQVRILVPGSPGCLVLVTSRDRLSGLVARDGATRITLDVLPPDESLALLTNRLGSERIRAERAAATALADVCAQLPLALCIAAAHLADHPDKRISDYVAELAAGDRLAALQAEGDEDTAVRAALAESYRTLPQATQRVFRLVGLVPGVDVTATATAALAGIERHEAETHLRRLASAHLTAEDGAGRFTMHDLIRLFARRLAAADEPTDQRVLAMQRLMSYYLYTADSADRQLFPEMLRLPLPPPPESVPVVDFDQPDSALSWLAGERANIVAGILHTAERGPVQFSWLLVDRLRGYFLRFRNTVDYFAVAEAALAAADRQANQQAQAAAHLCLASAHYASSRFPEAIKHFTLAESFARRADWADGQASALGNIGSALRSQGRLAEAVEYVAQGLELNRRNNHIGAQAVSSGNLAQIYEELGQLKRAADQHAYTLTLYRRVSATRGEAVALSDLGYVYYQLGQFDRAFSLITDGLARFRKILDQDGELDSLAALAELLGDAGRLAEALDNARAGVALAEEMNDSAGRAIALNSLGHVELLRRNPSVAIVHYRIAFDLARETGYRPAEAKALLGLACTQLALDDLGTARESCQLCLDLVRGVGYRVFDGRALTCLAEVRCRQGNLDEAGKHAHDALEHHRETGHRLGEARTLAVLGYIASTASRPAAAQQHWGAAVRLFADIGALVPDDLRAAASSPKP